MREQKGSLLMHTEFESAIARGWWVIPIPTRKKSPLIRGWPALRLKLEDAHTAIPDGFNAGVLLGVPCANGLYLVDVDLDSLDAIEAADRYLPSTDYIFGRPSKPRSHRFYYVDTAVPTKQFRVAPTNAMRLELRGAGCQTVLPGSVHPTGELIELAANGEPARVNAAELLRACEELNAACDKQSSPRPEAAVELAIISNESRDWYARCQKYLDQVPESISGQRGHDAMLRAMCEIYRFGLDGHQAGRMAAWFNSMHCSPPWSLKEIEHKLSSAKKIVSEAGEIGIRRREENALDPITCGPLTHTPDSELITSAANNGVRYLQTFPKHLLTPPGAMADLCNWMHATAYKPQPVLYLGAALAFLGAVYGRKIESETKIRSNIYAVGVAPSGSGKDHSLRCISMLVSEYGFAALEGPSNMTSPASIFQHLELNPSCCCRIDEFGHFLASVNAFSASTYLREVAVTFTQLFSQANYNTGVRAMSGGSVGGIQEPNLCIWAVAEDSSLYRGLTTAQIKDGLAARVLWLLVPREQTDPEPNYADMTPPPDNILNIMKYWMTRKDFEVCGPMNQRIRPKKVLFDDAAKSVRDSYVSDFRQRVIRSRGDHFDSFWNRAAEIATKAAMICAATDRPENPIISEEHAQWGFELVTYGFESFSVAVNNNLADTPFGQAQQRIKESLARAGGRLTLSDLCRNRSTRDIPIKLRDDALKQLMDSDCVRRIVERTSTRSRVLFELTQEVKRLD